MDQWLPGAAPDTRGKSHTMTADVERPDTNSEGVLVAYGSSRSGYVLYVKNNRLVYEYNFAGTVTRIESREELPAGASALRFEYQKGAGAAGTGVLSVNGRTIGEGAIPRTLPLLISWEGLNSRFPERCTRSSWK